LGPSRACPSPRRLGLGRLGLLLVGGGEDLVLGLALEQGDELVGLDRLAVEQDARELSSSSRCSERMSFEVWCASSTIRRTSSSISRATSSE